jgi:hypothetical protein
MDFYYKITLLQIFFFKISLADPAVVKVSIQINSLAERLIIGVAVLAPKAVLCKAI